MALSLPSEAVVKAQWPTWYQTITPGGPTITPGGIVNLAATATALALTPQNTPGIITATPKGAVDRTGCPELDVDPEGLDDAWAAVCSRCIKRLEPTAAVTIPAFVMATVPPLGTQLAALPTIPPMYLTPTLGGISPVYPTLPPPTGSPAPEYHEIFWDFTVDDYGVEIVDLNGYPAGAWEAGHGFIGVYHPENSVPLTAVVLRNTYSSYIPANADWGVWAEVGSRNYLAFDHGWGPDAGLPPALVEDLHINTALPFDVDYYLYEDVDSREWRVQVWSNGDQPPYDIRIVGMRWMWYGDLPEGGPTPTPAPTSTAAPAVIRCDEPVYKDISTPIAGIEVDTAVIDSDCYRVVPVLNSSDWSFVGVDLDVGLRIDGVDLCIEWVAFPTISVFGMVLAADLFFIVPIAYLVRRLLTF